MGIRTMGALVFHLISLNNLWRVIWKVAMRKNYASLWLCYMKKMTIITKIKGAKRHERQTNFGTWKSTFHWWVCNCHEIWQPCVTLFSLYFSNVIRQAGRQKFWFLEFSIWHLVTVYLFSAVHKALLVPRLFRERAFIYSRYS